MSNAITLSQTTPSAALAGRDDAMVERQLAVLGRLAEAGLEIAVALEGQAKGGEPVVEGDIAMAYARVARAVRQTIMLQSQLIEARRDREKAAADRKAAAKASAARILRDVIDDDRANDAERAERLAREAAERLEQEDFEGLFTRPFGVVVADICRELGLSPDWLRLAEQCAAAEGALNANPHEGPAEADADDGYGTRWDPSKDMVYGGTPPPPGEEHNYRKRRGRWERIVPEPPD